MMPASSGAPQNTQLPAGQKSRSPLLLLSAGQVLGSGLGAKPHPSKKLPLSPEGESKILWQLAVQGGAFLH